MKIRFDAIVEPGLTVQVTDSQWFPEADCGRVGPVQANLSFTRQERRVFLEGRLQYTGCFECDSCLEPYSEEQDLFFTIEFDYLAANDPYWLAEEHQCPQAEMDVEVLSEPEIDVYSILAQQVILSIPAKRRCSESCRGLCPSCGKNLNNESCLCRNREANSPFQVLAQLKVK
ncbi:MAG: DUF177 domain-containing protein [Desulfobulbaceae bacterium]|nr:DUF177 domain-containing protein [Desulfobulbaceae bacterium]